MENFDDIFELVKPTGKHIDFKLSIVLGLVLSVIIYLYYPFIQDYSTTPKWLVLSVLSMLLFLLPSQGRTAISWPMIIWIAFVFQYGLQAFRSTNFWEAIVHTGPMLIAPLIIMAVLRQSNSSKTFYKTIGALLACLLLPLLLISLIEISYWTLNDTYSHQATYTLRYTFGHRNQFGQFITLSVPLLWLSLRYIEQKWLKLLVGIAIGLVYLVVIFLMNRSSLIVLFGIYPLVFFIYWLSSKSKSLKRLVLVPTILIGVLFTGVVMIKPQLIPGSNYVFEMGFGSGNERIRIWKNSLELIKEHPLIGHGSGDWKIEILRQPLEFTQAENGMVFYQRAHNDFIQVATENGGIGLVIFILFFLFGIVAVFKSTQPKPDKFVMVAGILGFILIANLSFPLEKVELLILLFAFLMPSTPALNISANQSNRTYTTIGLVLMSVLMLILSFVKLKNERQYALFKTTSKMKHLDNLSNGFYTIDPVSTPINWHIGNVFFGNAQFLLAIQQYKLALKSNPYHIHVINNLASTFVKIDAIDSAKFYYDKALILKPRFTETLMNYTALEFNLGNIDGALGHILKVKIDHEPSSYKMYVAAIGQAKCRWLIELYDEEGFEQFLIDHADNGELLYDISLQSRTTGASFEDELRNFYQNSN